MIYTVKKNGEVVHRGDIHSTADYLNMSSKEIYIVVRMTSMGITCTSEKDPPKPRPVGVKKITTLKDHIKSMLMIYDNTAIGNEPKSKVDKALKELAEEGFVLEAAYNEVNKGWLITRKR